MRFALSKCKKCGQPLRFIEKSGKGGVMKWWPVNPDGSDHFDKCSEITNRLNGYVNSDGTPNLKRMAEAHPPDWTGLKVKHVYCGSLPPWDESLGEFRKFTSEEISAGAICRNPHRQHGTSEQAKRSGCLSTS
jgi:hypothetical protein